MNDKQYYRLYNNLQKKHERLSYRIVLKGLRKQFTYASKEYLNQPNTPIELLVRESDTLEFITEIYLNVGLEFATLVDKSLSKYKSFTQNLETKAAKPKEYKPSNNPNSVNIWRDEFIRLTHTKEIGDKVTKVTETTKNQIREVVRKGVEEKLSHKQIAQLILKETDSIKTKQRALTIARTENAVGSNKGAMYAGKTSGLVLYKKWIARSVDGKTRDAHAGMIDSTPIPIDGLFSVGGEKMAHPCDGSNGAGAGNIVNCRCVISLVPASRVVNTAINKPVKPKPVEIPKPALDFSKPMPMDFEDLSTYKPVKTVKEAEQFLIDKDIASSVDLSFIKDVDVANQMAETLFELKNEYNFSPIKIDISRKKNANMSANGGTLSINPSRFKTMKLAEKSYIDGVEGFKAGIEKNIAYYQSLVDNETLSIQTRNKFKRHLNAEKERLNYSRWTVKYSKNTVTKETITHEIAHVLQDQRTGYINGGYFNKNRGLPFSNELNSEWRGIYAKAVREKDMYNISNYGATSSAELFAESFVMYVNKDKSLPTYIAEYIERYLKITR